MLETLIAILLSLGLNFSKTDNGMIQVDQATMSKLQSTEQYQKAFTSESPIVVVPDIDPRESPIVVVPDIDPNK